MRATICCDRALPITSMGVRSKGSAAGPDAMFAPSSRSCRYGSNSHERLVVPDSSVTLLNHGFLTNNNEEGAKAGFGREAGEWRYNPHLVYSQGSSLTSAGLLSGDPCVRKAARFRGVMSSARSADRRLPQASRSMHPSAVTDTHAPGTNTNNGEIEAVPGMQR